MLGTLVASLRRAPPLLHAWPRALSLLSQQRAYVSVTQARMKIFGWWEPEGAASTPFNGLNRLRRRGWIGEKVRFDLDARARARARMTFLWLRLGARFSRPGSPTRVLSSRALVCVQVASYYPKPEPIMKHPLVRQHLHEEWFEEKEARRKLGKGPPKKGQGKRASRKK